MSDFEVSTGPFDRDEDRPWLQESNITLFGRDYPIRPAEQAAMALVEVTFKPLRITRQISETSWDVRCKLCRKGEGNYKAVRTESETNTWWNRHVQSKNHVQRFASNDEQRVRLTTALFGGNAVVLRGHLLIRGDNLTRLP